MPRELIDTGTEHPVRSCWGHDRLADARYVRRDSHGRFKESDDVGRSLTADRRQHAQHKSKKGEGDRGDR